MKHEVRRDRPYFILLLVLQTCPSWLKLGSNHLLQMMDVMIGCQPTEHNRLSRLKASIVPPFWFNPLKIILTDLRTSFGKGNQVHITHIWPLALVSLDHSFSEISSPLLLWLLILLCPSDLSSSISPCWDECDSRTVLPPKSSRRGSISLLIQFLTEFISLWL